MSNNKKPEGDVSVSSRDGSPKNVVYHGIVFVLSTAIICMQEHHLLAQAVCVKEVVETTNDAVGSISTLTSFISKTKITCRGTAS